jgi:hypothetical protein
MTTLFRIVIERTTGTCSSVISSGFTRHFSGKRKAAKAPSLPHRIQVTTNIFNFDVPSSDVPAVLPHLMESIRTPEVSPYCALLAMENK